VRPASIPPIDWRSHDQFSEHSLTCVCGAVFRSHSKAVMLDGGWSIQSRKACPACGSYTVRSARSDVETMTIGGQK
jgi:hypothetical protein